jgi:DNA-binding response OmpR family regulator
LNATILFIDDDAVEGKLIQLFLGEKRQDNVIVCNPTDQPPQNIIEQKQPDLILITATASFDFIQLCQELRVIPKLQETPIMFWRVARSPANFYPIAQQLGAVGWFEFPCQFEKLLEGRDIVLAGGTYYPLQY